MDSSTQKHRILSPIDYVNRGPTRSARYFLGKTLCVQGADGYTEGVILETEAYGGAKDRASHAYGNRRTPRTETMFAAGGVAYVYRCYGMHRLFNIVTGPVDSPESVMVRAVKITLGRELVQKRRGEALEKDWCNGPGRVCAALGIEMHHNRHDLALGDKIWIEDRGVRISPRAIKRAPRVGVDYAGAWALKPWRFIWSLH